MRGFYQAADLIIAKGQGNFESLSDRTENIFFLLKVKCPIIARDSGYDIDKPALISSRALKASQDTTPVYWLPNKGPQNEYKLLEMASNQVNPHPGPDPPQEFLPPEPRCQKRLV